MPKKLTSEWVRVATSGPTADDRFIEPETLIQMAVNYDPEEYLALIWYEHIRLFGNLGRVAELKSEKDNKNRDCLFARLTPSEDLLRLNASGQKIFTSIEVKPNWLKTDNPYLWGLAVTDTPASIATSELHFSHRTKDEDTFFSMPLEISPFSMERSPGFMERFIGNPFATKTLEDTQDMPDKRIDELFTLVEKQQQEFSNLHGSLTNIEKHLVDTEDADEQDPQDTPHSSDEFNALQESFSELNEKFSALQSKLDELEKETAPHQDVDFSTIGTDTTEYI